MSDELVRLPEVGRRLKHVIACEAGQGKDGVVDVCQSALTAGEQRHTAATS